MIKSIEEKPARHIEVDLSGPNGNAYYLMSLAESLGKQLGYDKIIIEDIIKTMKMSNYEDLISTFDIWFGKYVILYI
jgi:hypothetical protein